MAHTESYPQDLQYSEKWLQVLKSDMVVTMHHTVTMHQLQKKQKGVK